MKVPQMELQGITSVISKAFLESQKVIIFLKSGERLQGVIYATHISEDFIGLKPTEGENMPIKISEIAYIS